MSYFFQLWCSRRHTILSIIPFVIFLVSNSACAQIHPVAQPSLLVDFPSTTDGENGAIESTDSPVASSIPQTSSSPDNSPLSTNSVETTYVSTTVLALQSQSSLSRSFTGTLVARRVSELGYKRIGLIEMLSADQGDEIREGQVIAMMDTRVLESEKAVLSAQRNAAMARLDELVAGPRRQTIDAAYALLNEFRAVREQLYSTYQRRVKLANTDAISVQDIDDARHQLAAAEAKIQAQQFALSELEEGTRKEQIAAQQAEVARLDASIANIEVQIQESKLVAPYNAIVSRRLVDEGAIVQPGVPLFKIVELAPYEAWVGLPPEICDGLRIGNDYPLDVHGQAFKARLKAVLPELDTATRTQTAILDLDPNYIAGSDFDQRMGAVGEIVNLNLEQTVEQTGYWLPVSALTRGVKGLWSVYLVVKESDQDSDWSVQRSDVEIAQIDSSRVLINGTIKNGDRVVTSGVQKLTPGQRVKLINDSTSPDSLSPVQPVSKQ